MLGFNISSDDDTALALPPQNIAATTARAFAALESKMGQERTHSVQRQQLIQSVDIDDIEVQLSNPKTPDDTVDEFYRFGTVLFSEIQQRGAEVDRKLTNVLGWSIATLAFLLMNRNRYIDWTKLVVTGAAAMAFICVILSAFALKTRMWPAPSENDWFRRELWAEPAMLRRYHVVSLLSTHQTHVKNVKLKADCLGWLEILLSISALGIFTVLLFS
jgi:hypothetical protein